MSESQTELSIPELIESGGLQIFFQPIVSVRRKAVMGVEALMRGQHSQTGQLLTPKDLIQLALAQQVYPQLDRTARNQALANFFQRGFHTQILLFLNLDLDLVCADRQVQELIDRVRMLGIPPSSVVLEMVESQFDETDRLNRVVSRFREHGMLVAVDDVGAGHSNLERISLIRPDILKIDRSLCGKLGTDRCTEEVFAALSVLARKIGALVVAEGIETHRQAVIALERGADLLQGYLVHKPEPALSIQLEQARSAACSLAGYFREHMVQSINHNKIERRMHSILLDSMLSEISITEQSAFSATLQRTIRSYPDIECAYILDHRGTQVTETVFNAHETPPVGYLFQPAEKQTDHSLKQYYYALLDNETNRYVTEPYISLASGHLCRTLSATFRDRSNERLYILCIDVKAT